MQTPMLAVVLHNPFSRLRLPRLQRMLHLMVSEITLQILLPYRWLTLFFHSLGSLIFFRVHETGLLRSELQLLLCQHFLRIDALTMFRSLLMELVVMGWHLFFAGQLRKWVSFLLDLVYWIRNTLLWSPAQQLAGMAVNIDNVWSWTLKLRSALFQTRHRSYLQ